jgi:hypothetical protein
MQLCRRASLARDPDIRRQIMSVSVGACFVVTVVLPRGQIDRLASIAHALTSRDAKITYRKLRAWEAFKVSP